MKVKDLMTTDVKCCAEYNTLNTAAQMMWDYDIGCIPVIDKDGRAIGMLTDRDICMSAYIQGVPLTGRARDQRNVERGFFLHARGRHCGCRKVDEGKADSPIAGDRC